MNLVIELRTDARKRKDFATTVSAPRFQKLVSCWKIAPPARNGAGPLKTFDDTGAIGSQRLRIRASFHAPSHSWH